MRERNGAAGPGKRVGAAALRRSVCVCESVSAHGSAGASSTHISKTYVLNAFFFTQSESRANRSRINKYLRSTQGVAMCARMMFN